MIEGDGEVRESLSIYCPSCASWSDVETKRGQKRATNALRHYADLPPGGAPNRDGPPIGSLMSRQVICVRPETPLAKLTLLFEERGIASAVVLGDDNHLMGIVTRSDLLRRDEDLSANPFHDDGVPVGFQIDRQIEGTVADILTPYVFTLPSEAGVRRAAALMAYERVHHLVVASPGGPVEGILSSGDIMRWVGSEAGFVVSHAAPRRLAVQPPVTQPPPIAPAAPHTLLQRQDPEPEAPARSILVVDDDTDLREEVADILREEGYRVTTAANGIEALTLLRHYQRPSLILLDLSMPLMNGWSFYTEICKDPALAKIPLVLLSGSAEAPELAGKMGAGEVLQKPLTLRSLLGTVARRVVA